MKSPRGFLPTLLAAVAAASAAAAAEDGRSLQDAMMCIGMAIVGQGTVADCCPAGSEDSFCVLLTCVDMNGPDGITIREGTDCTCNDVVAACPDVTQFETFVGGITSTCDQMKICCEDDGSTTNADAEACMRKAEADGTLQVPDLSAVLGDTPIVFEPGPVILPETAATDPPPVVIEPAATEPPAHGEPDHDHDVDHNTLPTDGAKPPPPPPPEAEATTAATAAAVATTGATEAAAADPTGDAAGVQEPESDAAERGVGALAALAVSVVAAVVV